MRLEVGKGFLLTGRQSVGKEHYRKWLRGIAVEDITAMVSVQIPEPDTHYPTTSCGRRSIRSTVRQ